MSTDKNTNRIPELRRAVRQARDDAFLVEPRVVRRIIRELHGFARLSTRIPHTEVLVAKAEDVQALAHPDELGLEDFRELPERSILVAQPEEHELAEQSMQDLLQMMWKRLFHGCIDIRLQQQVTSGVLTRSVVHDLIDQLGQVEFDEAHAVIKTEVRLFDPDSRIEAFCEFSAIYHQMMLFSPDLLATWFPSLSETSPVLSIISKYVDAARLFESSRLYGSTAPDLTSGAANDESALASERESWTDAITWKPSARRHARLMKAHDRWMERGNTVAAAVLAMRASGAATTEEERQAATEIAQLDIRILANRLRDALKFSEADLADWQTSLGELLTNSVIGFWNSDKRLLYDLQKVCLDHERTIYQVDLMKWIVSRGKRPIRRPLTNVREVMMAKHLGMSAARLVSVRLSGAERVRLSRLLHEAADLAEHQMRERMRATVHQTILDVGLTPRSIPEQVACDKMVEESLDCITERGYLTMGYLRDAISRNDLKLPDLTDPKDLIRGDHLLRTDDRLDVSLDGVYRRGEFYLRWLQIISSLAFGTRVGRFATLFMAIPFGGAVVIVVGLEHMLDVISKPPEAAKPAAVTASFDPGAGEAVADDVIVASEGDAAAPTVDLLEEDAAAEVTAPGEQIEPEAVAAGALPISLAAVGEEVSVEMSTTTVVGKPHALRPAYVYFRDHSVELSLVIGILLMGIIHLPAFRSICQTLMLQAWKLFRKVVYDLPMKLLSLPIVQQFWKARWFVWLRRHVLNPVLLVSFFGWLVPWVLGRTPLDVLWIATVSFVLSAVLNSRLGRDAEELTAEWLANAWYDLRSRFLMALLDWIIDFFKWLLNTLERFIYAVDEWLRFHSGETWMTVVAKAVLGVVWWFVSYLLRIYVTLLIEPTLHPVKHFPVVTVAHKIFLPVILVIEHHMRETLTPYLGVALAGPITWFNIVFLPGIFGFLVWELKENWRLYASNRVPNLVPVVIGSHGENGGRLLKPGFHSGTLPKLFNHLRKIETKAASFHRFSQRRALGESLEHVERDIHRFIDRDLVRLLSYCAVWAAQPIRCHRVHAASNSFQVELLCDGIEGVPLHLLFEEQSGWLVATISKHGWLDHATPEMQHSFETALRGLYAKAGVDLVREQIERQLVGSHPYDVRTDGLVIWPERQFDREILVDLHRRHQVRPMPPALAASYGFVPLSREALVFAENKTRWNEWKHVWAIPSDSESANPLPLACMQSARASLIAWRKA